MINQKCMIRLRVSHEHAHYGGNLVSGGFTVGLFNDVATELLVRLTKWVLRKRPGHASFSWTTVRLSRRGKPIDVISRPREERTRKFLSEVL